MAELLQRIASGKGIPEDAGKILDDAAQYIGTSGQRGPDAQSRITRAPIYFDNLANRSGPLYPNGFDEDPKPRLGRDYQYSTTTGVEGDTGTSQIHIERDGMPSWRVLQQAIAHGDVHQAHVKDNVRAKTAPPSAADDAMRRGYMAPSGWKRILPSKEDWRDELPANATAFRDGDLPGVRQQQADEEFDAYVKQLPATTAKKLQDIRRAYQASQDFAASYGR